MNQRYWWQAHTKDDLSELNFLWTQWKVNSEIDKLPSKIPKPIIEKNEDGGSEDSSEAEGSDEDENKVVLSNKFMHVLAPEQNLPHDSKKLYNRLEDNHHLSNKKSLFLNMKLYYESLGQNPFDVLPVTFHIKKGQNDEEFAKFKAYFNDQKEKCIADPTLSNVWIVKPGENSNRGS